MSERARGDCGLVLAALLVGCSAAACDRILPFQSVAGASEAAPLDAAPADAAPADAPLDADLPSPPDRPRSDRPRVETAPLPDLGTPDAVDPLALCQGITLYAPFDNTFDGKLPSGALVSATTVTSSGGGVVLQNGGIVGTKAAFTGKGEVQFPASVFKVSAGSVAMWVKLTYGTFPPAYTWWLHRVDFFAGPFVRYDEPGQSLGTSNRGPDGGPFASTQAVAPVSALAPVHWKQPGWNHVVSTWSQTGSERLTFTLNGDPAGGFPTRVSTGAAWQPASGTPFIFALGGTTINTSAASYDLEEVVIWSRALSLAEIKALHALGPAGKSVGAHCAIP